MGTHKCLIACAALALLACCASYSQAGAPDRTLPWTTAEVIAPRVVYRTFDSKAVGAKVSYHTYVPEAYDRTEDRLPVLYWLHGTEGGVAGIRPLAVFFDDAMEGGSLPPMIVVFVNGLPRRLWADSKDGASPVETVVITEVIPDVDRSFRTIASRQGRILEGFSMGGYGATRLGFKYPGLFAGISILAGGPFDLELRGPLMDENPSLREELLRDVCGNDPGYFREISPWSTAEGAAQDLRDRGTVIRHVVGIRDATRDLNRQFHERMDDLRIPHDFFEVPGVGHDVLALLVAMGQGNGEFYRRALGLDAEEGRPGRAPAPPF